VNKQSDYITSSIRSRELMCDDEVKWRAGNPWTNWATVTSWEDTVVHTVRSPAYQQQFRSLRAHFPWWWWWYDDDDDDMMMMIWLWWY